MFFDILAYLYGWSRWRDVKATWWDAVIQLGSTLFIELNQIYGALN